ncbi:CoA transferase [Oscillatoria amoena NRMC-F 0135]|nr:CoA transferase [Oscillatoria amoena NRMC-F 0135]
MLDKPLQGIKVIELASVLAGPAVGMFLAELGAEVIKIENPATGGDVTRSWKLPTESIDNPLSAYFCAVNWGKQHLFLDLKSPEGKQQVYELAKSADILVANYKPGDAQKLSMDYDTFKAINPKLIYAELTGYGNNDPRAAFDVVLQAEVGYMSMNGTPDSGPVKMPFAMIDLLAAHQLKQGILLALWQREKTGNGCHVSTTLYDSGLAMLSNMATNWLMAGQVAHRIGNAHYNICPYGDILNCADGYQIVLAVGNNQQFAHLCELLGAANLAADERFATNPARVTNRPQLVLLLNELSAKLNGEHLLQQLQAAKVPAGAIQNMQQVFSTPAAQAMILEEDVDGIPTKRVKTVGFKLIE